MTYPIYCINLEHRKDRKQHSLEQLKKLGVSLDNVIYPKLTKDKRGGVYGCFDSHMKVWNDFIKNHPNSNYALICEDDFLAPSSNYLFKNAIEFINNNCDNLDILFLHDTCIDVENKINTKLFTNGYGIMAHAYFITRNYIQSILTRYGSLPEPNGRHFDVEINIGKCFSDNRLYSENIFYTRRECFKQLVDNSDNYLNPLDALFRVDVNIQFKFFINNFLIISKLKLLDDNQIRALMIIFISVSQIT